MLLESAIKEELSHAYVHAVATHAGFAVTRPLKDVDSVDAVIEAKGPLTPNPILLSPRIELQLKAHCCPPVQEPTFSFKLPVKNYSELRGKTMVPRLLVVLLLPEAKEEWLTHTPDGLISRRCAYWCSLQGAPETANTATQTITMQRDQRFTPQSLRELMVVASKGLGIQP